MEWIQENFLVPIAAGIVTLIIALMEKKVLKEDDNLRELREKQLSTVYGPIKMLIEKYEAEIICRQRLIQEMKDIWENHYLLLDNSLNKEIFEIVCSASNENIKAKLSKVKIEVEAKYNYLRKKVNYEIGVVDYRKEMDYCLDTFLVTSAVAIVVYFVFWATGASKESMEIIVDVIMISFFIYSLKFMWYFVRMAIDFIRRRQ